MKLSSRLLALTTTLISVSCSTYKISSSDYSIPQFQPPVNYKSTTSALHSISPSWWHAFKDSKLNSLQNQLLSQNLDLAIAYSRRQQALAKLGIARSDKFPQVNADGAITRVKSTQSRADNFNVSEYSNNYRVAANLSYELDLWGRVHKLVAAGKADLQAADYTTADVKVALQTQLARQYFALRFLDAEMATLKSDVSSRQDSLKIIQDRLDAGLTSELDTARANAELANAQAELLSLKGPRAELENSIAVLLGLQPSNFTISGKDYTGSLPSIPPGIPSALLYRRPDLAVAELRVAAATARIGVAEAERYPKISLTGSAGSSSISTSKFLEWSSQFYSIGPSVTLPIFQGKRIQSNISLTKAERAEALANYQKTALTAFADVESALASLSALRAEYKARKASVDANSRTYQLSNLRYQEGITSYLDVTDAQRERLAAKRTAVRTRGRQFQATVQLIQALGGGFSKASK